MALAALALLLHVLPAGAGPASGPAPVLSPEQQRWLAAHPVRLGAERDYGPFVFAREDGVVEGLSIDMLQLLVARTGLRLQLQAAQPLQALLDAARRREIDLLTSLRPTPERAVYLDFTQPYVSVPAVLVQRTGDAALTLVGLAGRPVAVGQGYAVEAVMRLRHPQVAWQPVRDDVVALQGVVDGRFDAAVVDAASVAFIQRQHQLSGLQAQQQVGFDYTLSFAVRRDWPQLTAVLNAAIQSLSPAERQAVLLRWLGRGDNTPPRPRWATTAGLWLLGLAGALAVWLTWRRHARARP